VLEDIETFTGLINRSQRRELKSRLINANFDILAPTHEVNKCLGEFVAVLQIESKCLNELW